MILDGSAVLLTMMEIAEAPDAIFTAEWTDTMMNYRSEMDLKLRRRKIYMVLLSYKWVARTKDVAIAMGFEKITLPC